MIIAIDGPAGSGKSTVAKIVSKELGYSYLDTGAMYRMVTLYNLENGADFKSVDKIIESIGTFDIMINGDNFYINDVLVNKEIRSQDVTRNVSFVASIKEVRKFLVNQQREIAKKTNCILDGRDIGSVVFPNAEFKFFLTASPEVRAQRRYNQIVNTENEQNLETILEDIIKRDHIDSNREESPLIQVDDAILIDTDSLSLEEVCDTIIKKVGK